MRYNNFVYCSNLTTINKLTALFFRIMEQNTFAVIRPCYAIQKKDGTNYR
ncbi:hypothetical protein BH10BAC2_BH10BAC2_19950 [soil metagenome]